MGETGYLASVKEKLRRTICVFPMGIAGKAMKDKLHELGIEIDCFSDNNEKLWGTEYKGKKCISVPELCEMEQDSLTVIVESLYYKEIKEQLKSKGIKNICRIYYEKIAAEEYTASHDIKEDVEAVLALCADQKSKDVYQHLIASWTMKELTDSYFETVYSKTQYFDKSVLALNDDEVYVDCGAYIGDSAEAFLSACGGQYEKMHLFELDPEIYKRLCKEVPKLHEKGNGLIQCYPYGVSSENAEIHFVSGDSSSAISSQTKGQTELVTGKVKKLDEILAGEKVTFIKMDIEGAEMGALKGAEHIIKSQKPALAVCIYHSPYDMLKIPQYIKKLVPEYRIFIRHYTDEMLETVCYAVLDTR